MIRSDGKNNFANNEFSYWEWSAPILQTYDEVISKIKELQLQGRIIKNFITIGMGYNWTEIDLGEAIYLALERKIESKQISSNGPFPSLPQEVYIPRRAELDEPFLIEFEDGDILAIDYSEGSSVRMEINTIPKDIHWGTNRKSFHPNVLFNSLIGKEIVAVEVTTSTECDEFTYSHGLDIGEQDSYIKKFSIVCRIDRDWEREKLEFSSYLDYGVIELKDYVGETITIHAPDIKEVVKGFIDESALSIEDDFRFND